MVGTENRSRRGTRICTAPFPAAVLDTGVRATILALHEPAAAQPLELAPGRGTEVRAAMSCHATLSAAAASRDADAHVAGRLAALCQTRAVSKAVGVLARVGVATGGRGRAAGGVPAGVHLAEAEDENPGKLARVAAEGRVADVVRAEGTAYRALRFAAVEEAGV